MSARKSESQELSAKLERARHREIIRTYRTLGLARAAERKRILDLPKLGTLGDELSPPAPTKSEIRNTTA